MHTRSLGSSLLGTSLLVSEQGLGCMGMTHSYGAADETESRSTIRLALDRGITFFDTADIYGPSTGEELLGDALAGIRDEVVIATKFGHEVMEAGGIRISGSPDYVRAACDASLARLKTDRIDLLYQHRVDLTVPIEETWGAMHGLVEAGRVDHSDSLGAAARELTGGVGVNVVLEGVGGDILRESFEGTDYNGRIVTAGSIAPTETAIDVRRFMVRSQITFTGTHFTPKESIKEVLRLLGRGSLRPVLARTFKLSEARQAHELLESRDLVGNLVLEV